MKTKQTVVQMPGVAQAVPDSFDDQPTVAPLVNVSLGVRALQAAINAPAHLPRIVAFYGASGAGKSTMAAYCANKYQAYYVEVQSLWTPTDLIEAILTDMGISPKGTNAKRIGQIAEELVLSRRPLIIDEFDYVVGKKMVEVVRDIYQGSHAPIMLIGEEQMPSRLTRWERFHRRVLVWQPSQPTTIDDVRCLARLYCARVTIADDLLGLVNRAGRGSAGRAAVNIERVREAALGAGLSMVDRAWWGDRELYTGDAPGRRV